MASRRPDRSRAGRPRLRAADLADRRVHDRGPVRGAGADRRDTSRPPARRRHPAARRPRGAASSRPPAAASCHTLAAADASARSVRTSTSSARRDAVAAVVTDGQRHAGVRRPALGGRDRRRRGLRRLRRGRVAEVVGRRWRPALGAGVGGRTGGGERRALRVGPEAGERRFSGHPWRPLDVLPKTSHAPVDPRGLRRSPASRRRTSHAPPDLPDVRRFPGPSP